MWFSAAKTAILTVYSDAREKADLTAVLASIRAAAHRKAIAGNGVFQRARDRYYN